MTPTPATCRSVLLLRVIRRRGAMLMTAISAGIAGRQCVQSRKVLSRRTARCASSTLATCPSLIDYTESVHRNTVVIMVVVMMMRIINKACHPKQAPNKVGAQFFHQLCVSGGNWCGRLKGWRTGICWCSSSCEVELSGENGGENIELLMVVMWVVMWWRVVICACGIAAASWARIGATTGTTPGSAKGRAFARRQAWRSTTTATATASQTAGHLEIQRKAG